VDVAEPLLEIARRRAAAEGLTQVEFRWADAGRTGLPDASFDVVVCVFGVFFVADMPAFVTEMARLTRSGGAVAVTTWGPGLSIRPTPFSGRLFAPGGRSFIRH
jgi:ubiquinone/menaquinone biosynthesis C-methylase UbiE